MLPLQTQILSSDTANFSELSTRIKTWAHDLGFQGVGITDIDLKKYEARFQTWIAQQFHGTMDYMVRHGNKRTQPAHLIPHTLRVISVRMDYLAANTATIKALKSKHQAYISRYALGRDYHKVIRKRLTQLVEQIKSVIPEAEHHYRVFCDSAPVLEKPLAEKAGLGWIGKHTNLINSKAGSWFFLGEIYTNLPLVYDGEVSASHCGSCNACLTVCPTQAIIAPYQLDARRCISYLTIELRDAIPEALRSLIGNRVYGCDDCQLVCPWNKFAKFTQENDFKPRHSLDNLGLITGFNWREEDFLTRTEGSAIRRIGYERWLRNFAVALGNAPFEEEILQALYARLNTVSNLVRLHIEWAIDQQMRKRQNPALNPVAETWLAKVKRA